MWTLKDVLEGNVFNGTLTRGRSSATSASRSVFLIDTSPPR